MPIGTRLLQHTVYKYRGPVWVIQIEVTISYSDDTFGYIQIEVTVLYNDDTFGYIQIEIIVSYSDSTFGYIQLFVVSASKVFADMNLKENDKYIQMKCIEYIT